MKPIYFTASDRSSGLQELTGQELDLLVIGGGITGAGIVWDAALRGLKVALVEKRDFGWGTSSRSTKLIHGGLRYLKQGDIKLVREVGQERELLHRLAPHLVHSLKMLLPLYRGGSLGRFSTSFGLWVYDRLAKVKAEERRIMLDAAQTIRREPLLRKDGLLGGGLYVEYMTDDARLTLDIVRSAAAAGARTFNYTEVTRYYYDNGRIHGAYVSDPAGEEYLIRAKKVVNATGPWVDRMRELDGSKQGKRLFLTKGVHIVIPCDRFPIRQSLYFDTRDGRMVFAIPRGDVVYVGTTDTPYDGEIDRPMATAEDRDYLLDAVNRVFPEIGLTSDDVISSWVGLRPLIYEEGKGPSELSRRDEIFLAPTGLITIAGGKLTGFRKMAEKVVDLICRQLAEMDGRTFDPCITDRSPILGGGGLTPEEFASARQDWIDHAVSKGVPGERAEEWWFTYGLSAYGILERLTADRTGKDPLSEEVLLRAELEYGWEREMITKPDDFLIRRTGHLYFRPARVLSGLDPTVRFLSERQGWSEEEAERERERMMALYREAAFFPTDGDGDRLARLSS